MDLEVEMADVISVMQELFPREYTICLQRVQIKKLESMVEAKGAVENNDA